MIPSQTPHSLQLTMYLIRLLRFLNLSRYSNAFLPLSGRSQYQLSTVASIIIIWLRENKVLCRSRVLQNKRDVLSDLGENGTPTAGSRIRNTNQYATVFFNKGTAAIATASALSASTGAKYVFNRYFYALSHTIIANWQLHLVKTVNRTVTPCLLISFLIALPISIAHTSLLRCQLNWPWGLRYPPATRIANILACFNWGW